MTQQEYVNSEGIVYKLGDLYEDCAYRPMRLVVIDGADFDGISEIDGAYGCCSEKHCGVIKMTQEEADYVVKNGPRDKAVRDWYEKEAPDRIWWL